MLTSTLNEIAVTPDDRRYADLRSTYLRVGHPDLVLTARDEDDVVAAVRHAAEVRADTSERRVPFSVRSGGHGMSGSSTNDGGIVLDVRGLHAVEVTDPAAGLVRIGAGATWGEVAAALAPHDLVLTSGNFGDTGVGGLATAGGVGFFARRDGLTLDRVVGARVVTADGTVHEVSATSEPDLFWAVRGGMTQAGVVTELTFTAARQPGTLVVHQEADLLIDDLPGFTAAWGSLLGDAPREFTSNLQVQPLGDGRFVARASNVWSGEVDAATPVLEGFTGLAPLLGHRAAQVPYAQVVPTPRWPHHGQQKVHIDNVLIGGEVTRDSGAALAATLADPLMLVAELRSLGGAVNDTAATDTAWAHRHHSAMFATWAHPAPLSELDRAWAPLAAISAGKYGAYSADIRPESAALAWPGATGDRLRAIASRVDPDGLFDAGLVARAS